MIRRIGRIFSTIYTKTRGHGIKFGSASIDVVLNPYRSNSGIDGFGFTNSYDGVMLKGGWSDDVATFMKKRRIFGIYLNYSLGWKAGELGFLESIRFLRLLDIVSTPIKDIGIIGSLDNLEVLSISCHWTSYLDLSGLANLKYCFLSWNKGAETVFDCESLEYLSISEFKIEDYSRLSKLVNLKELSISNSTFSDLSILGKIMGLKKLELVNCRNLGSLDGIDTLNLLEWLSIDGCRKISTIEQVSSLRNLRVLQLRDTKDIDSLEPIRSLEKLEALSFYGDTRFVDGDLGVIEELDNISVLGFSGRRHYTHKPLTKYMNWDNLGTPVKVVEKVN